MPFITFEGGLNINSDSIKSFKDLGASDNQGYNWLELRFKNDTNGQETIQVRQTPNFITNLKAKLVEAVES